MPGSEEPVQSRALSELQFLDRKFAKTGFFKFDRYGSRLARNDSGDEAAHKRFVADQNNFLNVILVFVDFFDNVFRVCITNQVACLKKFFGAERLGQNFCVCATRGRRNLSKSNRTRVPGPESLAQFPPPFERLRASTVFCRRDAISGCALRLCRGEGSRGSQLVGLVPDVARFAQVNDFLRDADRVIGDALKTLGNGHHVEATDDDSGIFGHVTGQLTV